ncbi:MAG: HAMP domain-containing histidine kinase [Gammaproteobacteria bacterium]|nr:HAMP domain-containing histidine kinase [Gammaproteobacteria bacterium]
MTVFNNVITYRNYKQILIQNFTNKHIYDSQQTREDYRLLFDKLQYDFDKSVDENLTKIDQLHAIYQNEGENFNIEKAVTTLNSGIDKGDYQIFLINRDYIIEKSSYSKDVGYNLGQYKVLRDLIDSLFDGSIPVDVSPIKIDSASMQFKRYLLKLSHDGKYLLQIGYVLNILDELQQKYATIKHRKHIDLYLANENYLQPIKTDRIDLTKQSLHMGWEQTKDILTQLKNDLQIQSSSITSLLNANVSDHSIKLNAVLDRIFTDDSLRHNLNQENHKLTIYSITNGLFNKTNETKLLVKTVYPTFSLEKDLQTIYNQTALHIFVILAVMATSYLFILKTITNKLINIIENMRNNRQSNVKNIYVTEIAVLNDSFNALHHRLNEEIGRNADLLKENKQFIADTVHQIRTPLTNIMMNSELVKKLQPDDSLACYIDKIDSSINMLTNSFEDLAYITTADTIEYHPSRVDLSQVLTDRIEFFSTISKVNYREISSSVEANLFVHINPIELERIIDNNISNGIKYGEKGKHIIINAYAYAENVVLEFKTHGNPISDSNRIFERNYRENEAKRGLGLGLYMVKCICAKNEIQYKVAYLDEQNCFSYIFSWPQTTLQLPMPH